jgi:hypothetical protein
MAHHAVVGPPPIVSATLPLPACTAQGAEERAADAVRRKWAVTSLFRGGGASGAEVVRTKVYENYSLARAAAVGPYRQPTNEKLGSAVEALATQVEALTTQVTTQMTAVTTQLTALAGQTNGLQAEMQVANRRLLAAEARHCNAAAMSASDALSPVPHGVSPVPAAFPETREDFIIVTVPNMNLLIAHYVCGINT